MFSFFCANKVKCTLNIGTERERRKIDSVSRHPPPSSPFFYHESDGQKFIIGGLNFDCFVSFDSA